MPNLSSINNNWSISYSILFLVSRQNLEREITQIPPFVKLSKLGKTTDYCSRNKQKKQNWTTILLCKKLLQLHTINLFSDLNYKKNISLKTLLLLTPFFHSQTKQYIKRNLTRLSTFEFKSISNLDDLKPST